MKAAEPTPTCPQCGSNKLYKDGLRYLADGTTVQRWLCRECGYRFTDPNHKRRSKWKNPPFNLNLQNCINNNCQGNDDPEWRDPTSLGRLVQTLATVEKEEKTKSGQAGATEASGKIVEFLWWLKKQGYAESTIKSRVKLMKRLVKLGANLFDPDSVKEIIAKQNTWNPGRKELAVEAYSSFLTMLGGTWNPPRYKRIPKLPFIPLESEIDQLIACFGSKMATLLQLLKETGIRLGEAVRIRWQDIDFQSGVIRITPEKGSNPRVLKLSGKLLQMLNNIRRNAETENVFPSKSCIEAYYYRKRKQIAAKLCNPRLLQISFHTFRHWKATMEYAKTKDILHVMKILGHKSIQNTLVYTQLIDFKSDEYVCKTAENAREAAQLVEGGFEYVCTTPEGIMLFKKRK